MSNKNLLFSFSKLMSTHVINFCYQAGLGGESGSLANQRLMSCWLFNNTRITRRPDGPLNYTLHMLFWNVERLPPSLAHLSIYVKYTLFQSYQRIFMELPRPPLTPLLSWSFSTWGLKHLHPSYLPPKDNSINNTHILSLIDGKTIHCPRTIHCLHK